jgi:phosphoglucosamine mutase
MRKLFGTDGIRGVANVHPMTTEMAMQVGRGVAFIFKNESRRHRIVIGKDTRLSGYMLENALVAGICSMGVDVLLVGPLPTPGIAFITVSMRADAGIVISASHNPFQDNGIKIFSRDGFKLPDRLENQIEELISSDRIASLRPTAKEVGKAFRIDDAVGRYVVYLKNSFPREFTLEGMKIVLDCANGASYRAAPAVFEELGAKIIPLGVEPDGENINHRCGSLHPRVVTQAVKKFGADIGISLDGDADRAIFSDEKGNVVDGDQIMAFCARDLRQANRLKKNTLVATVMSNLQLDLTLRDLGIRVVRTQVGDRYVAEEMSRHGYNFGGEQSGHLIFLDYNTTGDGVLSALQVLAVMKREGKKLSELASILTPFPQVLLNVPVGHKKDPHQVPEVASRVKKIQKKLGEKGRILVRPSGTESLIRVMVEGEKAKEIRGYAEEIARCVRKNMAE